MLDDDALEVIRRAHQARDRQVDGKEPVEVGVAVWRRLRLAVLAGKVDRGLARDRPLQVDVKLDQPPVRNGITT